jgi:hypothetical protein
MRKNIRLKDFKPEEHVIAVIRHHWWVYVRDTIGLVVLFLIPFFFLPFVSAFITTGAGIDVPDGLVLFFGSLWALFLWNMFFARWTDQYFDIWIITNFRIIDIDQKGFFHRDISTLLTLEKIEDVTTRMVGIIGSILNFGKLRVQTAAAQREFFIDDIPNPRHAEQVIRNAQEQRLGLKAKTSL